MFCTENFFAQHRGFVYKTVLLMKPFLERNQNIRMLATSGDAIYKDWKEAAGWKLDVLALDCENDTEMVCGIVMKLFVDARFFNRLYIHARDTTIVWQFERNSIAKPEVLYINFPLSKWKLEELDLNEIQACYAIEAGLVDVLAFIRGLRKLKKLRIESFVDGALQNGSSLDLLAWKVEREQLAQAQKVTIYVEESNFLATKRAMYNGQTDYSLIELKRLESYDWNFTFGIM